MCGSQEPARAKLSGGQCLPGTVSERAGEAAASTAWEHGGEKHQGVKANKKIPKILFFPPISVTESGKGKV